MDGLGGREDQAVDRTGWGGGRRYGLCTLESGVNWLLWIGGGLDVESVRFVQHGDAVGVAQLRGCSHTHKEASSSLTGRVVCGVWCGPSKQRTAVL